MNKNILIVVGHVLAVGLLAVGLYCSITQDIEHETFEDDFKTMHTELDIERAYTTKLKKEADKQRSIIYGLSVEKQHLEAELQRMEADHQLKEDWFMDTARFLSKEEADHKAMAEYHQTIFETYDHFHDWLLGEATEAEIEHFFATGDWRDFNKHIIDHEETK